MIPSTLPSRPWEKIATNLFGLKGIIYLLLVDYYSKFVEVVKLSATTTKSVISAMMPIFASYGIPDVIVSDNGPQYLSQTFGEFVKNVNFKHVTSSPHHP